MIQKMLQAGTFVLALSFSFTLAQEASMEQSANDGAQAETPTEEIVLDERVIQYATCSALYGIMQHAVSKQSPDLAEQLENWSFLASLAGKDIIKQSQPAERAEKMFNSFLQLTINAMQQEMQNDVKNLSVLTNKYGGQCKALMESSAAVFEKLSQEAKAGKVE